MRYYPLFLDLSKLNCFVLGAGKVGRRKIASLQKAKARSILVLDPYLTESKFIDLFYQEHTLIPHVHYEQRNFYEEDLQGIRLAFAATTCTETNGLLAQICEKKEIFCNVIEEVSRGNFVVPSHIDYENLILALSTSGTSPALAKALKEDLKQWLDVGYAPFLRLMEQIRAFLLLNQNPHLQITQTRTEIFRNLVKKPCREEILQHIKDKNINALQMCVVKEIPNLNVNDIDWHYILQN